MLDLEERSIQGGEITRVDTELTLIWDFEPTKHHLRKLNGAGCFSDAIAISDVDIGRVRQLDLRIRWWQDPKV